MTPGDDYKTPPRSWANIAAVADNVRSQLGLTDQPYLPVMEIIEKVMDQHMGLLDFQIGSVKEMGTAEGYTCPQGTFIMLREDVYRDAWQGQGRARFTAAHELGHWALHANVPLARATKGDGTPAYMLAEPQANQFAAAILMPRGFINPYDTEGDLAKRFGVSRDAARRRLSKGGP